MRFEEPFHSLAETLLKGGIAPRHVRRYLHELSDHLDDLVRHQQEAGYTGEDARRRARALLGEDRELVAAMLEQPGLKSWTARWPWLFLGLLPPIAVVILFTLTTLPLVGIALSLKAGLPHGAAIPDWFQTLAYGVTGATNLLFAPGVALLVVTAARRQRLSRLWPVLGTLLIVLLAAQVQFGLDAPDAAHIGIGAVQWLNHASTLIQPLSMAQLALTLAPLVLLAARGAWARG